MNRARRKRQDGAVVARLLKLKSQAHRALAGDSNDAEHDALYEVKEGLGGLASDVRRMEDALKLCVEFLQNGKTRPRGDRRAHFLWVTAVSSTQSAPGRQRTKGERARAA